MEMNYHLLFKILLVGDAEVGNSVLLHPSVDDSTSSAIGVNFLKKKIEIGGKKIKLQIWNITGQDSSQAITTSYYHDTKGFLLMYDIANESSFENVTSWLGIIEEYASEGDCRKLLFATKCGREKTRQVTRERGEEFAHKHGMRYVENGNFDEAIKLLAEDILDKDYSEPFITGSELLSDYE